jgi:hypothetical protein
MQINFTLILGKILGSMFGWYSGLFFFVFFFFAPLHFISLMLRIGNFQQRVKLVDCIPTSFLFPKDDKDSWKKNKQDCTFQFNLQQQDWGKVT